ncbi:sugar ABC transporter permease [Lachnospiraceae bacterium MD1]|jgi:putative multiple sugar transport system permease protein|uniref:Xylose transport system permease protein XylH n=1 Tax=Variimorphobacter saccharofermentans TaxID=2755051 RepID=A0A839JZ31_9FIRM|nr:multiple monosaccharide ABC transporter permease [Variimorphobacter saccharofermentans]MBB2182624.1 sugar ABC transporter permease [Variimorphobacter saccharofermentans]
MNKGKDLLKKNSMLIALLIVTLFFTWQTGGTLLVPQNVTNLIAQNGYVVVLAVGMLICIITGGNIDLSVGSIVALVGALAGTLIVTKGMNIWLSIIICLAVGILIGAWQGFWIAYIRIPAFIVTLAGMLLWRGVALIILDGLTISPFPAEYLNIFNSYIPDIFGGSINILCILIGVMVCVIYIVLQVISLMNKKKRDNQTGPVSMILLRSAIICIVIMAAAFSMAYYKGIPAILILLAIVVVVYSYYTTKTVPGRYLYAMGGNEKAAKLSGINTNKVLFFSYVNMAFLSAVAALICVSRFNSAAPTTGTNYEMDAIGSCFIGGASAYGGTGSVSGVVIGAIFMGVINNGMSIMGIDTNVQKVVKGAVLLAAVAFDVLSKRRRKSE